MSVEKLSSSLCHGGDQQVWRHDSRATGTKMTFAAYIPEHEEGAKLPVLWFLAGLTCTHENAMVKCEYKKAANEHGVIVICPDTSPRGEGVADHEDYDFGQGAGFYVDATQQPWQPHFRMRSYIEDELPEVVAAALPVDMDRQAITGHSMGGHGALTIGLRNPGRFRSTSAFAPIISPLNCPWGEKALTGYLGDDRQDWREYDSVALIEDGARLQNVLVDQGSADEWLEGQLKTHLLQDAVRDAGLDWDIRMQDGYDHSYFFVSTFVAEHIAWHARHLKV
ncbi:S-formylglutathione hydrolase [Aurantiacibacter gangjinensis]|uniref:S-formylglutathione hydrolase n=1 Tax=Aurantiacibacter gangjinensis TaxID=502682 RepID=A0A0G9MME4_9SPHN|nr:S-formylglutathione hydrolase [Aurantiacibacter gangjinensis]APE27787.1 S-formylglutathione hydrolase [Aurantiacibacter gangjinensis]KLE31779.1 S-formylglutathione hydrolase [Aurantiacibacter gangjinensis]